MRITHTQFEESFYYIAPGKDFEPLLRFSHQCKYFLYANLYLSKEEILDYIRRFFKDNPFLELTGQTVYDDFDETRYFELHPKYVAHISNVDFLNPEAYIAYKRCFQPARSEKQWMIKLDIINAQLNRPLTLYYFTGEGLASYIALSQNGKYPPRILATVQTEVLERSNGLMLSLFGQTGGYPSQWIRGFEGSLYSGDRNDALKKDEVFNTVGMDFAFAWNVEGSYVDNMPDLSAPSTRFCKSFITGNYAREVLQRPFRAFGRNTIVYGDLYEVTAKALDLSKLVITTRHFDFDRLMRPAKTKVMFWEDILVNDSSWNSKFSMKQSLEKLGTVVKGSDADKIYFTPFGLEDEGQLLAEFLLRKYRPSLTAVVNRPLDLIDLRVN